MTSSHTFDSPLYGRRTAQMRLAPLPFTDVYAVQQMPFDQAVEQYAQAAFRNIWSSLKTDGSHKLGKIAGVLGQETSALTPYLATLTDGAIPFVPSHIGSYWLNDFDGDTEIDVMLNWRSPNFAKKVKF